MHFYLVRHGEATSENENPRRPLTDRGRRGVERMIRSAKQKGVTVCRILHSDKDRARETAEIVARQLSPPAGMAELNGLGPGDDPFLAKAELEVAENPIMLVGHLPHLGRLTSLLTQGDPDLETVDFPAAGMVCLSRQVTGWKINWTLDPAPW